MTKKASILIRRLGLKKHPEGGYYKEVFRSAQKVRSLAIAADRAGLTDIYFLLTKGQVSRFHQVRHDEVWNFYEGSPLRLYVLDQEQKVCKVYRLGPINQKGVYKVHVPGGHWQAAETTGAYTLVGCTVAPGFDFKDFKMLNPGSTLSKKLLKKHPKLARFI